MKNNTFFTGIGRRKTATVQVRLTTGTGQFIVNGEIIALPPKVEKILQLVDKYGLLNISIIARGGGHRGQLGAINLGVARALVELNPDFKSTLRKAGYLTRDSRIKERKKPGLKKARRAPQWAKR